MNWSFIRQWAQLGSVVIFIFFATTLPSHLTAQPQKKVSKTQKAYHDLTHQYNFFFNANLKVENAIKTLEGQHQENFNKILPMYKHMAVENRLAVAEDLNVAIKKSAIAISLHRVSHWTDDSYLLMGQSQYLKGEYHEAEVTFNYIISELDPAKLKKKKKESKKENSLTKKEPNSKSKTTDSKKDKNSLRKVKRPRDAEGNLVLPKEEEQETPTTNEEGKNKKTDEKIEDKPKSYFLKHRPVHKDAFIELAKTQIEQEKYDEAFIILNRMRKEGGLKRALKAKLEATEAYAYLKRKEYNKAIVALEKVVKLTKSRKEKVRFTYILAQLYQQTEQFPKAYATFEQVLKLSPTYEMEFNARLSIAKNAWMNGEGSIEEAEIALKKMLKDEKNEEYLDQIYFALADIELKRNNRSAAIQYLQKSVYNNVNNQPQKAEAFFLLAELHYQAEIYTKAKYYYDSTMTALAKSDERYDRVEHLSNALTDIAKNIEIVAWQDSLLKINAMTDSERFALALKIKEDERKKATEKESTKKVTRPGRGMLATNAPVFGGAGANNSTTSAVGTWWAYDAELLRKGKREFEKKWGDRKLSDNWRRSNRKDLERLGNEDDLTTADFAELTEAEVAEIFKKIGVPQTETDIKATNDKIMNAMIALGSLYRDRLKNTAKAIDILEQLMKRYPQHPTRLESLYMLYLLYSELPNRPKAEFYKNLILEEGKDSKFAKAITDPNFLKAEEARHQQITTYYDQAYAQFSKGQYEQALDRVDKSEALFGKNNPIKPKFALLAAMCVGNLRGKDAYVLALNDLVKTYPKTDEQAKATEILKYLTGDEEGSTKPTKARREETSVDSEYAVNNNTVHFFAATYDPSLVQRNDLEANFSDFNKKYYQLQRLRTNVIYLDKDTPILIIKRFKDKEEAMKYYTSVVATISEFVKPETVKLRSMVLSQDNYKTLIRKKDINAYLQFFEENYK